MDADKFLKLHRSVDNSFNRVTPMETKLVRVHSDALKPGVTSSARVPITGSTLFLIPILSIMVWAIVIFRLSGAWKVTRERIGGFKQSELMPCRTCRFFANNHYLKCAVQPSIVLTKQALNCSDYWSDSRRY